jgi:hypothetical protein
MSSYSFFDYLEGAAGLAEFIDNFPYLQNQAIKVLEKIAKFMILLEQNSRTYTTR